MKFKVGDNAKVIREGTHCQEIGAIVKILSVDKAGKCYYADCPYNGKWCIKEDELTTISFTKSDLKDGDIVTQRDGCKKIFDNSEKYFYGIGKETGLSLSNYREDLTDKDGDTEYDIIKVERPIQYETVFERKEKNTRQSRKEIFKKCY